MQLVVKSTTLRVARLRALDSATYAWPSSNTRDNDISTQSNVVPCKDSCNNSSNRSPYRIQCNSSSNGLPIGCSVVVVLTGLPIGYSVIVALTGLPIQHSVIVALTGLPIGYSVIVTLTVSLYVMVALTRSHIQQKHRQTHLALMNRHGPS